MCKKVLRRHDSMVCTGSQGAAKHNSKSFRSAEANTNFMSSHSIDANEEIVGIIMLCQWVILFVYIVNGLGLSTRLLFLGL